MSPLSLRRYRAERLLREQFASLRATVLASTRGRLHASGVRPGEIELEACYAQAWQGLYAAVMDGEQIGNPAGWLAVVTFRRAIDEHRARVRDPTPSPPDRSSRARACGSPGSEGVNGDFAEELDQRLTLRQLLAAMRARLTARELQAATLCYLQGMTRSEAAAAMGVSEPSMRKLMEGRGPGRPGVAAKVGTLARTIRDGGWCEEQGSLMRGFAYGILDPHGDRYQLAMIHSRDCPACRSYVASLRGLAAALPPLPLALHVAFGAGDLSAHAAGGAGVHGVAAVGGHGAAAQGGSVGLVLPASGAAGAGAAGGGWLVAGGGAGAKLALACALALGLGAGCVTLTSPQVGHGAPRHERVSHAAADRGARGRPLVAGAGAGTARAPLAYGQPAAVASAAALSPAARAIREFGPEQPPAMTAARGPSSSSSSSSTQAPTASVASVGGEGGRAGAEFSAARSSPPAGGEAHGVTPASAGEAHARREFSPG